MKICGYECSTENFSYLREITFNCKLSEIDDIIKFLQHVRIAHDIPETDGFSYSHYRDWDKKWTEDDSDIIVMTDYSVKQV